MTDNNDSAELHEDLPSDIAALLGDPATWEPVDTDLEDSIVAAIMSEAADAEDAGITELQVVEPAVADASVDNVLPLPSRWKTAALGAAAALVVAGGILGGALALTADTPDIEVALAGTELAQGASAEAELTDLPEGTLIKLTVSGLPPAEPGTYYEAWLRKDAEVGVSAGTFHLREGEGPIDLWAAVSPQDYPLLTVTIQDEAQTMSSGRVVLKALIDVGEE